jgi:peptide/nickel transport system permease protein
MVIVALFAIGAAAAPLISGSLGFDPLVPATDRTVSPPTAPDGVHLLGTDALGRDLLSRIVHGARISLLVGVVAEIIAIVIGVVIGGCAGYAGGRIDAWLMRITDLVFAFPAPLLALATIAAIPDPENLPLLRLLPEPSLAVVFLVLGGIGWVGIARLVRGEFMKNREQEFARAAEAIGAGGVRVIVRHLLPNAAAPIIVSGTLGVGGNILMESWLSFLGIGASPPAPSWGNMVTEGQAYILSKPWVCFFPGLAVLIVVLGFNLLGDGLSARLDPRRRRAGA